MSVIPCDAVLLWSDPGSLATVSLLVVVVLSRSVRWWWGREKHRQRYVDGT